MDDRTLICSFEVPGKLVPWSVPTVVGRSGRRGAIKEPRLVAFQADVAYRARLAMAGRKPAEGPVELLLWLWRRADPAKGERPGDWWWEATARAGSPDRTNLAKGIEDALQGVVFANDNQVVRGDAVKRLAEADGCKVVAYALADPAALRNIRTVSAS